ncbi:hypothetical protein Sjap_013274 [Stephania japonica]|uniref:Uncharacterized protein n=1 Tax=Stephania japonica TaxID=461633 RepID=A0AAP0IXG1_9MAGN
MLVEESPTFPHITAINGGGAAQSGGPVVAKSRETGQKPSPQFVKKEDRCLHLCSAVGGGFEVAGMLVTAVVLPAVMPTADRLCHSRTNTQSQDSDIELRVEFAFWSVKNRYWADEIQVHRELTPPFRGACSTFWAESPEARERGPSTLFKNFLSFFDDVKDTVGPSPAAPLITSVKLSKPETYCDRVETHGLKPRRCHSRRLRVPIGTP